MYSDGLPMSPARLVADAGRMSQEEPEDGPLTEEFGAVADRIIGPVAVADARATLVYANPAAGHALGQEPAWLVGRSLLSLVHPDDRRRFTRSFRSVVDGRPVAGEAVVRLRAHDGRPWRTFEATATNLLDHPAVQGILISARDISEQLLKEQGLRDAAYRDHLTGLGNRAWIEENLATLVGEDASAVVAFLGVDRIKVVNESLGHGAGDLVLEVVGSRLESVLPSSVKVGRFAGDVFAVLLRGGFADDPRPIMWRAVEKLSEPIFAGGHELRISVSVGIAVKDAQSTAASLMQDASLALHRAKVEGRGRVTLFAPELRQDAVNRFEIEADLRRAIAGSELSLALQPIVRLADRSPAGSEALIRWTREGLEVSSTQLIRIAEESGLILDLGEWILDQSARFAADGRPGCITMNLSARQLVAPGFVELVRRTLRRRKVQRGALSFEITETLVMDDFDLAAGILRELRRLGCRVGLDDFGAGYSSLGYLRRLPIDFLKIDGSLTRDVDRDRQAQAVIAAVISMAGGLGLEVVAEGIETDAQAVALQGLGCRLGQGFLLGRPEIR